MNGVISSSKVLVLDKVFPMITEGFLRAITGLAKDCEDVLVVVVVVISMDADEVGAVVVVCGGVSHLDCVSEGRIQPTAASGLVVETGVGVVIY